MRIKRLHINSHNHLHDLKFDFTYPKGHSKEGKPLEKICIIGQSATGKTSILELLLTQIKKLNQLQVLENKYIWKDFLPFDGEIEVDFGKYSCVWERDTITKGESKYGPMPASGGGTVAKLIQDKIRVIYLSADILSSDIINVFDQNPLNLINTLKDKKYSHIKSNLESYYNIFEFNKELNEELWFSILYKVLTYRQKFTQMASELINKGSIGDIKRLNKEYEKWAKVNENPLIQFANTFNPILNKLNLEVDLINTEYPIPIKSLTNDEIVPISKLSTGTKGLLLSMFPLFEIETSQSLILIDEPERSLFPDIQVELISNYQKIAPNAQLIIATHSPFIASSFEPEERFVLYFDKEGTVQVKNGISPIGDDPNDILNNDFNVDYYNEFGKNAYKEYLSLKQSINNEKDLNKKNLLLQSLVKLGDKYNF